MHHTKKIKIHVLDQKLISENTNNLLKTQFNFLKQISISENTNQFPKPQTDFPKHKLLFQNTSQFPKKQIKDWVLTPWLSESLDFLRPIRRLLQTVLTKLFATAYVMRVFATVMYARQDGRHDFWFSVLIAFFGALSINCPPINCQL